MHPLTLFPELLTFMLFAPLLLRLTVGVLRILAGVEGYKKSYKWLAVISIISSVLLILGLYTQIVAIIAIACIKIEYWAEQKSGKMTREKTVLTILMIAVLLSLLVTGPGFLAFDLPL